ncbi:hypothetical protein D3C87_1831490 [compost metagenome]
MPALAVHLVHVETPATAIEGDDDVVARRRGDRKETRHARFRRTDGGALPLLKRHRIPGRIRRTRHRSRKRKADRQDRSHPGDDPHHAYFRLAVTERPAP